MQFHLMVDRPRLIKAQMISQGLVENVVKSPVI
jgi:hypothetical protein